MPLRLLPLLFLLLLLPLAAAPARAQGFRFERAEKQLEEELADGFIARADRIRIDEARGVAVAAGNVSFTSARRAAIQLFADGVVAWGKIERGRIAGDIEVYAEGNVLLLAFGDSFEADWAVFDFARREGRLARATVRTAGRVTGLGTLLARAERARIEDGLRTFSGEDAQVSTCPFHEPHYAFTARSVRLERREEEVLDPEEDEPKAYAHISVERPGLEVYGLPLVRWPFTLGWDTAWNPFIPLPRLGRTGRFGAFAQVEAPVYPGRDLAVSLQTDLYERRGVGLGANADWSGPSGDRRTFLGSVTGIWIHDQARADRSGFVPPDRDRGRVRAFHRDDLPLGLRREGELSWISDRGFLREYFEAEAKTGKEQETALYARWLGRAAGLDRAANMGATLLGRWRLDDFRTQVEWLPRGRWSWIAEPFLGDVMPGGRGLYLTAAWEVANARPRFDEETLLRARRVLRADLENRIDWPFPLGPVQVDPFAIARWSGWSERAAERARPIDRFASGAGAVATLDLWRDFGEWRHVATPSVGYSNLFHVETDPDELTPIDSVEAEVVEGESVPIALRNRVQTWWGRPGQVVNVVDWNVLVRLFPDPGDNAGERAGPLRSDLRLAPVDGVGFRWRSDWDLDRRGPAASRGRDLGLFRSDAELAIQPEPGVVFTAAHRFFENAYRTVEGGLDVRLTEKWSLRAGSQFDFESDRFTYHRLGVRRFLHRFVLEVLVEADFGEDDVRWGVTFLPLELFGGRTPFVSDDISRATSPMF